MYEFPRLWIEEGNEVTIVTSPYDKSDIKATKFIEKQTIDKIQLIIINIKQTNKHSILYRAFTFCLFSIISIYFALTRKYDIILCSSGPVTIGLPGIFAKTFRRNKKFVFEVRDLWPDGAIQLGLMTNKLFIKLAYYFEKLCYTKADLIVTCSKGMSGSIQKRFDKTNLLTIPNACDYEFFQGINPNFTLPDWAANKKIFIYTGSLGLMDDCIQIIKGIELMNPTKEIFVFIGEGNEKKALEQYVVQHQIPNTYFIGLIPKTAVRSWLQYAYAAFVTFKNIPTLQMSSPNKMFDAFAAGVPVIQTTNGWIKDLISKEKCGVTVDPELPGEMCKAIKELSDDPETRNNMSVAARRLAVTEFNRKILGEEYLKAMERSFCK